MLRKIERDKKKKKKLPSIGGTGRKEEWICLKSVIATSFNSKQSSDWMFALLMQLCVCAYKCTHSCMDTFIHLYANVSYTQRNKNSSALCKCICVHLCIKIIFSHIHTHTNA